MSDNARFHNKLHRKNHHTLPTVGYPDSAIDPIASPSEPFIGDFYLTGSLSAHNNVYVGDRLGVRTGNPNLAATINGGLCAKEDSYFDQDLYVKGDASIYGNLSAFSDTTIGSDASDTLRINAGPILMPNAVNAVDGIIMGGDTNLYRGAANQLKTDDDLFVAANTTLGDTATDTTVIRGITKIADSSATNGILFGTGNASYDTNLYRSAADTLKTDDNFIVAANTTLGDAATDQAVIRGIAKIADSSATNGILFGSGDANYDVNLYRKSANVLRTDDAFEVGGGMTVAGDFGVTGNTTLGDTCADTTAINGNLVINCTTELNGIRFSDGAGGTDTVLFRGAADTLRTNDAFVAGTTLNVIGNTTLGDANTDQTVIRGITKIADSSSGNGILFGSGDANYDTNLYRSAANELSTDDNFKVAGSTTLGDTSSDQTVMRGIVKIADSSDTNGILFGSGDANYDTNLYRSAANELRTNDNMIIDGNLTIVGNLTALGTYSRLDTLITGTSSLQVTNNGSDTALTVRQTGPVNIATFYDDNNPVLNLRDGGNVGIGTMVPNNKLTVMGRVSAAAFRAEQGTPNNADSSTNGYAFGPDGDTGIFSPLNPSRLNDASNGQVSLYSNNNEVLRAFYNAGARVGIGTSNPTTTLTVSGDILGTGNLNINGNTVLGDANTDQTIIRGIAKIADSSSTNGILFGSGNTNYDVNLYRSAANILKTDDNLVIGTLASAVYDDVLIVDSNGLVQKRTISSNAWNPGATYLTGPALTTNYITKKDAATNTLINSIIQDDGSKVGIGITPATNHMLTVGGTAKLSRNDTSLEGGQLNIARSSDDAAAYGIDVYGSGTTPSLRILDLVAVASRFELNSSGNFGLGASINNSYKISIGGNTYMSGTATIGTVNAGTTDTVLILDASGNVQKRTISSSVWSGIAGGIVGGTGTINYVPKWSSSTNLTDSSIFDNGSVGIGTTTPGAKLEIAAGALGTTAGNTLEIGQFSSTVSNVSKLRIYNKRLANGTDWTTASTRIQQRIDVTDQGYIEFNPSAGNNGIGFGVNATEYMRIQSGGNVGIGISAPTYLLHVNGSLGVGAITCTSVNTQNGNLTMGTGDITCDTIGCAGITCTSINTTNGNINAGTGSIAGGIITGTTLRSTGDVVAYYVSDSRLKENKVPLNNSLEKLQKIEAYSFDWKEVDESICTRKGHDVGLLAQEVREILPEAIYERGNGYLSLDYIKIIPLLVSSIKELKAEIELLKAK